MGLGGFACSPTLLGRWLVFSNSLENISIFLPWAGWEFLQGTRLLQAGECG